MTQPDNHAATEAAQQAAQQPPAKRGPKPFVQTLQDLHFGHTADELTDALQECIGASEKTGKATRLTLVIDIKPKKAGSGRYEVVPSVTTKLPAKENEAMDMFVGPDGNLSTRDPRQPDLPGMRVIDKNTQAQALRVGQDEQQSPGIRVG